MAARRVSVGLMVVVMGFLGRAWAEELPLVGKVALQPLAAHAKAVVEAMEFMGQPVDAATRAAIEKAASAGDEADGVKGIQAALDPLCLVGVDINPEARVKASAGPAKASLVEQG